MLTDDALTAAMAAFLEAREQWDEIPAIMAIYQEDNGAVVFGEPIMPPVVWMTGQAPERTLIEIAECVRDSPLLGLLRETVPPGFRGLAFYSETWTVRTPHVPAAAVAAAYRQEASLKYHRGRVETKSLWAVTGAGWYFAELDRGHTRATFAHALDHDRSMGPAIGALDKLYRSFTT